MTTPEAGRCRIAVIGGGVFGLSAALVLARRGHVVTVFDRFGVPSRYGSSVDSSRLVRPDYGSDGFFTDLGLAAIREWRTWNVEAVKCGFGQLYHENGTVFFRDGTIDHGGYEHDSVEQLRQRGRIVRRLGRDAAGKTQSPFLAIPAWTFGDLTVCNDGYLQPESGWANARASVEFMAHLAREAGVMFVTGSEGELARIVDDGASRVTGVITADGRTHLADKVLVAAGPWTPSLVPELDGLIQAVGQPLVYVQVPEHLRPMFQGNAFPNFAFDLARRGLYGFPAEASSDYKLKVGIHGNGYVYYGRTRDGRTCSMPAPGVPPPASVVQTVQQFINTSFPQLCDQPITEARLCYYCDSWDSYFYIDGVPGRPGLYVAAGGSGHGFKFAPVLGDIIADAVEGRPNVRGAPFKWRVRPSASTREAEACRMLTGLPEPLVLPSTWDVSKL